jgi:hypothetical protein
MRWRLFLLLAGQALLVTIPSRGEDASSGNTERSAETLLQHASTQMAVGEYGPARDTALEAIDSIQVEEQPDARLLIDALVSRGKAYLGDGMYPAALESFGDASDLSRREDGLFNDQRQWRTRDGPNPRSWSWTQESRDVYVEILRLVEDEFDLRAVMANAPDAAHANVELELVVDEAGQVPAVRIVSADPPWAGDAAVALASRSVCRPRFEDDEFVAAAGRYTWSFAYDPAMAVSRGLADPADH